MTSIEKSHDVVIRLEKVYYALCCDMLVDPHDRNYILRRLQQEGVKFLSVTLPSFSKYAIECVTNGCIIKDHPKVTSFRWKRRSPVFMSGLLNEAVAGNASSLAVIRQVCEYFYKTAFSFTPLELVKASIDYHEIEKEVGQFELDRKFVSNCRKALFRLFPSIVNLKPDQFMGLGKGRDGPGAFSESKNIAMVFKCTPNEFKRLPVSKIGLIDRALRPFAGSFKSYARSHEPNKFVDDLQHAEVLFVPKDSRGPRVISKEPYFALKAQMLAMDVLVPLIEKDSRHRVNFLNQETNQELARIGSLTGVYATLDLEKASDRNARKSNILLTRGANALSFIVRTLSTKFAKLDGHKFRLNKLANMGSGVCFPFLALTVFISIVTNVADARGIPLEEAASNVYVYGDDICLPTRYVNSAIEGLKKWGYSVNTGKSYFTGPFRESCGSDYMSGIDVTPVRFRLTGEGLDTVNKYRNGCIPVRSHNGILQLERHCRELVKRGLKNLSDYYYRLLERRLGLLPYVDFDSHALGRTTLGYFPMTFTDQTVFVPKQEFTVNRAVCQHKALGRALRTDTMGADFARVPERGQIKLIKQVLGPSQIYSYGLSSPLVSETVGGKVNYPSSIRSFYSSYANCKVE
jgi:hypothetical protein